jgi:Outer membrane protein beta-barrel domain
MKKLFVTSVALFSLFTAMAQVSVGLQAGGHLASMKSESDGTEQPGKKSLLGFKFGAVASIPVSDQVSFMPALNFVTKGGKFSENSVENVGLGTVTTTADQTVSMSFIEIPLNIAYTSPSEDGSGFFGGLGPVLSLGVGGKSEGSATIKTVIPGFVDNTTTTDFSGKIKFDGKKNDGTDGNFHLKGFEFGGNVFAGYRLSNGVFAKASYNIGFSNLSPDDKSVVKNSYFGITIGYFFGAGAQ